MDFDPDHAKWQCCCCHLASGLKILATTEIVICSVFLLFGGVDLYRSFKSSSSESDDFIFEFGVIFTTLFMIVASSLLIIGISKVKVKLMYPTITARVILIIFVTVFGVRQVVVEPNEDAKRPTLPPKKLVDRKFHQDEPSVVLRLVFLVFLMIFVCIGVFYTIYLVVRCIRYIQAYSRLEQRRASLIFASQIDPELLNGRRVSKASNI
ncbi:hypothetical protein FO519_001528 [Halicephalobus sp. NKZ332]|nr:hypothetical protein FO519_001528 [Halicephalobus sp. NKZ332]